MKAVRELGSDRRETGRSLSAVGGGNLRSVSPSTRGLGRTDLWCAGCRARGIAELRELAGAPPYEPPTPPEDPALTDLDRAVDVLVEMKNISEVAVGLAYSALVLQDSGLAEVRDLAQWMLDSGTGLAQPAAGRGSVTERDILADYAGFLRGLVDLSGSRPPTYATQKGH